jgi:hypothetical protein
MVPFPGSSVLRICYICPAGARSGPCWPTVKKHFQFLLQAHIGAVQHIALFYKDNLQIYRLGNFS